MFPRGCIWGEAGRSRELLIWVWGSKNSKFLDEGKIIRLAKEKRREVKDHRNLIFSKGVICQVVGFSLVVGTKAEAPREEMRRVSCTVQGREIGPPVREWNL